MKIFKTKATKVVLITGFIFLAGCTTAANAAPVPVTTFIPVEVVKQIEVEKLVEINKGTLRIEYVYVDVPITRYEYLWKEPRQFEDTEELDDYLASIPALMPIEGQDCDDIARRFMLNALKDGYLVSTEILDNYRGQGFHMLNSTVIGNSIYFIEPSTNGYWWAMPLD